MTINFREASTLAVHECSEPANRREQVRFLLLAIVYALWDIGDRLGRAQ